jgi:hypothetical protein
MRRSLSANSGPTRLAMSAGRRTSIALALAAVMLALLALGWHLDALASYNDAALAGTPAQGRLASAQVAARMEPWNVRFAWRVIALRGLVIFESGDVDGAYRLLEPYSPIVHGEDATFVAIYQAVVKVKTPLDSRKAHLAHGADPLLDFREHPLPPSGQPSSAATATSSTVTTP